jgi:hypothetical protein
MADLTDQRPLGDSGNSPAQLGPVQCDWICLTRTPDGLHIAQCNARVPREVLRRLARRALPLLRLKHALTDSARSAPVRPSRSPAGQRPAAAGCGVMSSTDGLA